MGHARTYSISTVSRHVFLCSVHHFARSFRRVWTTINTRWTQQRSGIRRLNHSPTQPQTSVVIQRSSTEGRAHEQCKARRRRGSSGGRWNSAFRNTDPSTSIYICIDSAPVRWNNWLQANGCCRMRIACRNCSTEPFSTEPARTLDACEKRRPLF